MEPRNVAAMIHRHKTLQIQPVWSKRNHSPDLSSRGSESESRNLPKWQTLPCVGYYRYLGRFLHSADAAVGMTYVFALIVADTNVLQFWLTPDGGKIAAATPDSSNVIPFFRYSSGVGTWRAADCRWNYGVIATGNQQILIRCAEHHPYMYVGG